MVQNKLFAQVGFHLSKIIYPGNILEPPSSRPLPLCHRAATRRRLSRPRRIVLRLVEGIPLSSSLYEISSRCGMSG